MARRCAVVVFIVAALTGCGGGDSPSESGPDAGGGNFQLRIRGDTATALMPSPEIARRFCDSIENGVSGSGLVGVRHVRLRAYGLRKAVVCRVPKPSLLD
jgi:hypothetical protein